jgi:hypothetical protein
VNSQPLAWFCPFSFEPDLSHTFILYYYHDIIHQRNISKLIDIDNAMIIIRCIMRRTKQTRTKLLVIVITTTAIIAAATTTSLGAARPAFAKVNCNEDGFICSSGQSNF